MKRIGTEIPTTVRKEIKIRKQISKKKKEEAKKAKLYVNLASEPALRTSYQVSNGTRNLEPFHNIKEYRVLNLKYQVLSMGKSCVLLFFFRWKSRIIR